MLPANYLAHLNSLVSQIPPSSEEDPSDPTHVSAECGGSASSIGTTHPITDQRAASVERLAAPRVSAALSQAPLQTARSAGGLLGRALVPAPVGGGSASSSTLEAATTTSDELSRLRAILRETGFLGPCFLKGMRLYNEDMFEHIFKNNADRVVTRFKVSYQQAILIEKTLKDEVFPLFRRLSEDLSSGESLFSILKTRTRFLFNILLKKTHVYRFLKDKTEINNRFDDILCPANTAVQYGPCYLHANRIGGLAGSSDCFVASGAPLKKDHFLFWHAIFESDSAIIDLTMPLEIGPEPNQLVTYYPERLDETLEFGSLSVKLVNIAEVKEVAEGLKMYTYTLTVTKETQQTNKTVIRYHYSNWQDRNVLFLNDFESLIKTIKEKTKGSLWVHCRGGVGRTGTFITAMILKEKIDLGLITDENLAETLLEIILLLKVERGPLFVQNDIQLDFLLRYGRYLLTQRLS